MMAKMRHDLGWVLPAFQASVDDDPGMLVQAGETLLTGIRATNAVAAVSYLQLFDAAALDDVTLGTTTADHVIANAASANLSVSLGDFPLHFSLGLVIFSTTTATGNTGAAQHVSVEYA